MYTSEQSQAIVTLADIRAALTEYELTEFFILVREGYTYSEAFEKLYSHNN